MASRTNRGKKGLKVRAENSAVDQALIDYGKTFPYVPGLSRSLVSLAPSAIRVTLKYGFSTTLTASTGLANTQVFTGNGIFDPDVTGVGGQPLGFDNWMAIYNRYRVLASTIAFRVSTPDASTNDAALFRCVLVPSVLATAFTNPSAAAAQPYAYDTVLNGIGVIQQRPIQGTMETSLITGRPKVSVMSDDLLSGSSSTNPGDLWYWHIMIVASDGAATVPAVLMGEITYLVDLYDRNLLSLSSSASSDALRERRKLERKSSKRSLIASPKGKTPKCDDD